MRVISVDKKGRGYTVTIDDVVTSDGQKKRITIPMSKAKKCYPELLEVHAAREQEGKKNDIDDDASAADSGSSFKRSNSTNSTRSSASTSSDSSVELPRPRDIKAVETTETSVDKEPLDRWEPPNVPLPKPPQPIRRCSTFNHPHPHDNRGDRKRVYPCDSGRSAITSRPKRVMTVCQNGPNYRKLTFYGYAEVFYDTQNFFISDPSGQLFPVGRFC